MKRFVLLFIAPLALLCVCAQSSPVMLAGRYVVADEGGGDPDPEGAQTWAQRIAQPGVVWYHGFESEAEVNAFRWSLGFSGGNDPNANGEDAEYVRLAEGAGPDGFNALEAYYPAGDSPNSVHWIRPFSPLNTGSGKSADDPAANGTMTVRTWSPTNGGSQTSSWSHGWYRHENATGSGTREGHCFYLQLRVKMDPNRIAGANESHRVGKFVWFSTTSVSFADGEHVTYSYGNGGNQGSDKNYLRMYAANRSGAGYTDPLNTTSRIQENSDSEDDWYYSGGWDTLLYHICPGDEGVATGDDATSLKIWAASEGETTYTKIWEQQYSIAGWESGGGLNALYLTAYNNGNDFETAFSHQYAQVIFSKGWIAPPAPEPEPETFPSWYPEEAGVIVEVPDGDTTILSAALASGGGYDSGDIAITPPWSGGALVYVDSQPYLVVSGGGHNDGSYNGILKFGPLYGEGSDTPAWSVFLGPSDESDVRINGPYADGRQQACHTYNNLVGVGHELFHLSCDGEWGNGSSDDTPFKFTPAGQVGPLATNPRSQRYGACAYYEGKIYCGYGTNNWDRLRIYDIADDSWSSESNADFAIQNYVAAAIDTTRGKFLLTNGSTSYYWDLATLTRTSGINAPPSYDQSLEYDPDRDVFVSVVDGSQTVYEVDAAELAAGNNPSWTSRTFSGDTPSAAEPAGTYGRFRYVSELKGYILVPRQGSGVYFYRST
jgi:hypothetical protein